jgi:hypothetical protein
VSGQEARGTKVRAPGLFADRPMDSSPLDAGAAEDRDPRFLVDTMLGRLAHWVRAWAATRSIWARLGDT